jgi:hypothetical protein
MDINFKCLKVEIGPSYQNAPDNCSVAAAEKSSRTLKHPVLRNIRNILFSAEMFDLFGTNRTVQKSCQTHSRGFYGCFFSFSFFFSDHRS